MIERTYIKNAHEKIGNEILISGWVNVRRDHGKLIFFDVRDRTGVIQAVVLPSHKEAYDVAKELRSEWVVSMKGIINKRPEKMINADSPTGDIELEITSIEIFSRAEELPFDKDSELNLDTYFDHLPLTLRTERSRAIFSVQEKIITAFRNFLTINDFVEIQPPKIIGEDAEGGANSFSFDYFGHTAHLAQSPQFYKQIMVGVFEKVFATTSVYRAEKHSTTRHLNEYTSLDLEMGFVSGHRDVMRIERELLAYITQILKETSEKEFALLGAEIPTVPDEIPSLKLREAQKLLSDALGVDCTNEPDLEPQHERWLSLYSQKTYGSDFIFITHFPLSKRPMYTFEDPDDKGYARGFDLLFRGVEITTGGQRIHDYKTLVESIKKKGLDPEKFSFYLQAFKYGMPPHGGLGMGLERLTAKLLGLENVKEATLFPRDINRIDKLLSQ
jgi:nondiscriminating aspartyl-tRNA synthetase